MDRVAWAQFCRIVPLRWRRVSSLEKRGRRLEPALDDPRMLSANKIQQLNGQSNQERESMFSLMSREQRKQIIAPPLLLTEYRLYRYIQM